ncbi:MAG TPA: hypothetical protein EYH19_08850 [Desulfocapsa sulfexigens]|nr:hypothetical protein [Desulfocapsa sulfexigens]
MAQLHCYVPDEVAEQLLQKAKQAHLSVSKYLSQLVKNEIRSQWPEDYFDLFGSWQGDSLKRSEQGGFEQRLEFK